DAVASTDTGSCAVPGACTVPDPVVGTSGQRGFADVADVTVDRVRVPDGRGIDRETVTASRAAEQRRSGTDVAVRRFDAGDRIGVAERVPARTCARAGIPAVSGQADDLVTAATTATGCRVTAVGGPPRVDLRGPVGPGPEQFVAIGHAQVDTDLVEEPE